MVVDTRGRSCRMLLESLQTSTSPYVILARGSISADLPRRTRAYITRLIKKSGCTLEAGASVIYTG